MFFLKKKHMKSVEMYSNIAASLLIIKEDVEEWGDEGFTSPDSEEDDD